MTLGIQEACCSTPECFAFFSGFGEAPQKRGIKKHEHYSDLLINISEAVGCVCFVAAQMHIVGLVGCRVTATVSLRRCNPLFVFSASASCGGLVCSQHRKSSRCP